MGYMYQDDRDHLTRVLKYCIVLYCIVLIFLLVNVGLLRNYAILSFDEGAVLQHTFVIFIVSADVALTGLRAAKLLLKGAVQTPHELYDTRKFQKIGNLRTALRDFYAIRPQFIQKVKLDGGVSYMYYIIEKKICNIQII